MNKTNPLAILLVLMLIISCKTAVISVPVELKNCIANNITKKEEALGFEKKQTLEQTFDTFEEFLIKEKFLKDRSKEEYQKFIEKIVSEPKIYRKISNHIKNPEIYEDGYYIMNPSLMLTQCSDYILVTQKHAYDSTLNLQNNIIKRIIGSGYSDMELIKELFSATPEKDFKELMYRIPFIYIITMNAEIGVDPRNN